MGLKHFIITEGGKAVWKDGSYVHGVAGITSGKQDVDAITFAVGSGEYCFKIE